MNEHDHDIETFVLDIDQVISGELVVSSVGDDHDREYLELLMLAQVLARADFSREIPKRKKRIWERLHQSGRLEDDELDQVAGGLNLNALLEERGKKK